MTEYDKLPKDLRAWLSSAVLPWRARSVRRAFDRALRKTGDRALALRELDRLQAALVRKDARRVWGGLHPHAQ
ncbi:DUF6525 family protein [Marivita sp. S6314]|uniref:DUF6525 family protein n=1 Tax=Marivita sp. S6314 TaxID=2926406 RepID=UPI001FF2F8EB|nr:DUF6525 family protein [Marivita sp. S6314]MCK0152009.1 DUF6525 family protein [Marivita sp. S6314]